MKNFIKMRGIRVCAAIAVVALVSPAHSVWAQLACGATISGTEIMDADLDCTAFAGDALTILSGGALDMDGHTLSDCNGGLSDGIVLAGADSTLKNGVVKGCNVGVRIEGTGGHEVVAMVSTGNLGDGFQIAGGCDANTLVNIAAIDNGDAGIRVGDFSTETKASENQLLGTSATDNSWGLLILGDRNKLQNCTVAANGHGIALTGDRNKFQDCLVANNSGDGIVVNGSRNVLKRTLSSNHQGHGFRITSGDRNKLNRVSSISNFSGGIRISDGAVGTKLVKSTSTDDGTWGVTVMGVADTLIKDVTVTDAQGAGIAGGGPGLVVRGCRVLGCGGSGISNGATGITVTDNVVIGNNRDGGFAFDIYEIPNCTGNTWLNNVFGSVYDGGAGCVE